MSVRRVSVIVGYSVRENGSPTLTRHIALPSLRTLPNDKSGTLIYVFADDASPRFFVNGKLAGKEVVTRIHHLGLMTIDTIFGNYREVGLRRTIFSSTENPLVMRNTLLRTARPKQSLSKSKILKKLSVQVLPAASVGVYVISSEVLLPHTKRINPGDTADFALAFAGREAGTGPLRIDPAAEERVAKGTCR